MSAEDILKLIDEMENDERWNLLKSLYDLYFNKGESIKEIEIDY